MSERMRRIAFLTLAWSLIVAASASGQQVLSRETTSDASEASTSALELLPTSFLIEIGGVQAEAEEPLTIENVETRAPTVNPLRLMLMGWREGAYGQYSILNGNQTSQDSQASLGQIIVLVHLFETEDQAWSFAEELNAKWRKLGSRVDSIPEFGAASIGFQRLDAEVVETVIIVQIGPWAVLVTGSVTASGGALDDASLAAFHDQYLFPAIDQIVQDAEQTIETALNSPGVGTGEFSREPSKSVANYNHPGYEHTDLPVTYAEHPPVGGPHNLIWYTCQYYNVVIRSEHAVHSLEHGAVWITFDPDLPQDQKDVIRRITEERSHILASPMVGLPAPVVASSWNHQILLDDAYDPDLRRFIAVYLQGPDTPEIGASCIGITDPAGA